MALSLNAPAIPESEAGVALPSRHRLERAQLSFKSWVENKAAPPAAMGLIVALVLRSAQVWSFGAFNLNALPTPLRVALDVMTGICAALAMELLMSAAGAQWYKLADEAILATFDTQTKKQEREARAKILTKKARIFLFFTIIGALASIVGSMYFAVTSTGNGSVGALLLDLALAAGITTGVFFFGVIYEPARPDASKQAQEATDAKVNEQALDIAGRITTGDARPEHIAFLKNVVSPQTARKLDALMPRPDGMEYWDTPKILRWLGLEGDAAARDIRRKLAKAQDIPALGVRRKAIGQGLEAPESALVTIFQADIERQMRRGIAQSLTGESAALRRDLDGAGVVGMGQSAGNRRRSRASVPRADWLETLRAVSVPAEMSVASDEGRTS